MTALRGNPEFEALQLEIVADNYDGAAWHYAVIRSGLLGHVETRHGARDRWDWGVTVRTLDAAQQRHGRLQALADGLTPEQKAALWADPSEQAKVLRRFVR